MNILILYYATPGTTAEYLVKAMRKTHTVKTLGPQSAGATRHDLPQPGGTIRVDRLYREISKHWKPDFFLMIDGPCALYPGGVTALPIPTLYYAIDSHIAFPSHAAFASLFDAVLLAQKQYAQPLKRVSGNTEVSWLPLACDPEVHAAPKLPKIHDLCFLGGRQTVGRIKILDRLAKRFDVHVDFVPHTEMARVYSQSKIVFNRSVGNDLNMRVFEAMASGSMLLTDRLEQNGLDELFVDREDLVLYDTDNLESLAAYYLEHADQREKIAASGHEKVRRLHTYETRAQGIIETAQRLMTQIPNKKSRRLREAWSFKKVWFHQSRFGQRLKNSTPDATYSDLGIEVL